MQINPVSEVKTLAHTDLFFDHRLRGFDQFLPGNIDLACHAPKHRIMPKSANHLNRVAQGLAGYCAPMGTATTDVAIVLDHGDVMSTFGQFHRRTLTGGAGADHNRVVFFCCHSRRVVQTQALRVSAIGEMLCKFGVIVDSASAVRHLPNAQISSQN